MKNRFLKAIIAAALILAIIPGCSSDEDKKDGAATSSSVKTTEGSSAAATTPHVDKSKLKETYKLSEEDASKYESENSPAPITYGGFEGHFFSTPASSDAAVMTITPVYSHTDIHNYIHSYMNIFDLGSGAGSLSEKFESYTDEFFTDKALLVISFLDKEGGSNYEIMGGWDDHVSGEGFEMDRFILGVKKADGNITAGHVIVEIDKDFLGIWDTFGMEIYK